MTCFQIDMLPARRGDSLWIEYGDPQQPSRLLIDGGTSGTYGEIRRRLLELPENQRHLELLVVTHIDTDHIEGVLKLLEDDEIGVTLGDVWFNGWQHLPGIEFVSFGPAQGEKLSTLLFRSQVPWNDKFGGERVSIPDAGALPTCRLPGGMDLTLLSPGVSELEQLRPFWEQECREHGLIPSVEPPPPEEMPSFGFEVLGPPDVEALAEAPSEDDHSKANASSIAFLAEFDGRRALLAGDAYADVLSDALQRLVAPGGGDRLRLDAFKLSHHGSKSNVTPEILEKVDCQRYLFSTNGGGSRLQHPNQEAVARVLKYGGEAPQLYFNYRQVYNRIWNDQGLMDQYGYCVRYPAAGQEGLVVDL